VRPLGAMVLSLYWAQMSSRNASEATSATCWSCLVMLALGTQICPICGADQKTPACVGASDPCQPELDAVRTSVRHWGPMGVVTFAGFTALCCIFWYNLKPPNVTPDLIAAQVAAQSLRQVRECLSTYSLSAKDTYPPSLDALGSTPNLSIQTAAKAGYDVVYTPESAPSGGPIRTFAIVARPKETEYLKLYIDDSGVVRATSENRMATAQDSPF